MRKTIVQNLGKKFSRWTTTWLSIGVFGIGLLMMLVGSYRLRGKELFTVLAIGGALLSFAFITMVVFAFHRRDIQVYESQHERDMLQEQIERLRRDRENMERDVNARKGDLDRLTGNQKLLEKRLKEERDKRVKLLGIRMMLDLSFFEVEGEITKCFDRYFGVNGQEVTEKEKTAGRFVGALHTKFVAKYGVNLSKVQVKCLDSDKLIRFAGIEPSFLGFTRYPDSRWEHSVGLSRGSFLSGSFLSKCDWKTDENSEKLAHRLVKEYQIEMAENLKNGPQQPEWIKNALKRSIRLFLERFFAPPGYRVEFMESIDHGATPFPKYKDSLGLKDTSLRLLP
jgi:hypothetical protein